MDQMKCFDTYGGRDFVVSDIFEKFEKRENRIDCNYLYWGTYCMREQVCQYNRNLYLQLISLHPEVVLALAVCGSEKAAELAANFNNNGACTKDLNGRIESECNIACKVAAAETPEDVCSLLEDQAGCIERLSSGCKKAEEKYALPRLDTYAIANKYMGCDITYNGLKVQATADSKCEYSEMLNKCFNAHAIEDALTFTRLHPLVNRDFPVREFCPSLAKFLQPVANCTTAYLSGQVPQAHLFGKVASYDESFAPEMGAFPLNSWGLSSLAEWVLSACGQNIAWTEQLCVLDEPSTTTERKREKTTPQKTTPHGPRTMRPTTPRNNRENDAENLEGIDSSNFIKASKAGLALSLLAAIVFGCAMYLL
jgi:hypothetical protein